MAGNYGGNSIPTTPIGGEHLFAGRAAEFRNYECKTIVSTAATSNFTLNGSVFSINAVGATLDLAVSAKALTSVPVGVYFLCYECSGCDVDGFTGTTAPSSYYSGMTAMNRPTIIGGGGLNN